MRHIHSPLSALVLAAGLLGFAPGCTPKKSEPDVVPLSGKVVATDVKRGTLSVEYEHPKQHKKMTDTADVNESTEIMINGVLAKLSDIQVGEHVRGEVQVEGKGNERKLTVLKIYVDRAHED